MKSVIDWVLVAVGAALALVGAWWMWTGWDIVQAERGWAAVISGSVLFGAGVLTLALARLSMKLERLASGQPATAFEADQPEEHVIRAPTPVPVSPSLPEPAMAHSDDGRGHDLEARDEWTEPVSPPPESATAVRPSVADLMRGAERPETSEEERDERDLLAAEKSGEEPALDHSWRRHDPAPLGFARPPLFSRSREEAPSEPAAVETSPEIAHEEDARIGGLHAVEPPPFEPPFATHRENDAATSHEHRLERERADDWLDEPESLLGPRDPERAPFVASDEHLHGREGGHEEPQVSAEPPKPPSITGRYSSGDTNYTMYDDGSIEAQTPDGVMRFASLVELRRFVEQRK